MTYDLHGSWGRITGIHGALYPGFYDNTASNVDACIKFLLSKNVPRSKIIMGIATYGVSFKLLNETQNGVGAPASAGVHMNFVDLCPLLNSGFYSSHWESNQKVPFAFRNRDWIGYENLKSVTEKANYINSQYLGGAMFWSLDGDDFSNSCGGGSFTLITAVRNILKWKFEFRKSWLMIFKYFIKIWNFKNC